MDDIQFSLDNNDILDLNSDINLSDDEINIKKTKKQKKKFKATLKPKNRVVTAPPVAKTSAPAPVNRPTVQAAPFLDKTFEAFSNPQKRAASPDEDLPESNIGDDESQHAPSEVAESAGYEYNNAVEDDTEARPSAGFNTIEDEKQDLLYRFHRLEQKGIRIPKKFNLYSDIREMRADFERLKRDHEVNASIKFSRKMLMAVVSATEFLNKRYDPFGIELNGWSETVMENSTDGDYDQIFERLHDKYSGKVNTPPEMELMMSLGGSAIMFHLSSTMFKNIPNMSKTPEMQEAMKSMAQNIMQQQMAQARSEEEEESNQGKYKMKGPSFDLSGFGGMMPPPMPSQMFPQNNQEPSVAESVLSDNDSEESGMSVKQVSVTAGGTRRGRKPKILASKEATIDI